MNTAIKLDLQDQTTHSPFNKTPASVLQEYAVRNRLVPQYEPIHQSSHTNRFKYSLTLEKYKVWGEGSSKKEARHAAALNLLNKMIEDKPELLNTELKQWDFKSHVVSPFDNNIKVNAIGKLHEICSLNKLGLPEFNLVREEGKNHSKLFTMSCHVAKMVETATHKTKKQTKNMVAFQMVQKLMSIDMSMVIEDQMQKSQAPSSMDVLERVIKLKSEQTKKRTPTDDEVSNYHLNFKATEWKNTETLNKIVIEYKKNNKLVLQNPYTVLQTITEECGMALVKSFSPVVSETEQYQTCFLRINNVNPNIMCIGIANDIEEAQENAANKLLINICILSI